MKATLDLAVGNAVLVKATVWTTPAVDNASRLGGRAALLAAALLFPAALPLVK